MATGLNFQTQTIINSNVDINSSKVNGKGADNSYLFKGANNTLRIKRDFTFYKDQVKGIRKKTGYDAKMCKATINFASMDIIPTDSKKYCRLDVYIAIEGAEPFIYSTPWVQKGMPFWVEFTVNKGDTAATVAKKVADMLKKNHTFQCDSDLVSVTVNDTKLILEGTTEYQRFKNIEVYEYDVYTDDSESLAKLGSAAITLDQRGENSFGTYSQIIKDLRLPTAENTHWTHIRNMETPIVGAIYDQYIIEYEAPATNDGLGAVGQKTTSCTTHVFWVKNDPTLISAWETALEAIGTVVDVMASSSSILSEESL